MPGSDPPQYEEESYVDRHDDPYGPMNDDMEQIDWRRYRPKVDEQYYAAALIIQANHTIAEIRAMGGAEKPTLQNMSRSIGLTTTKTKTQEATAVAQARTMNSSLQRCPNAALHP